MKRQRHQQGHKGGLHFASTITYKLWEVKAVTGSKRWSALASQSLTPCEKAKTATGLKRCALCRRNHLHPVGRQRQQQDQKGGLHFSTITYMLWKGKASNRIKKVVCTLQTQSLTYCGKGNAATGSKMWSALAGTITYKL